MPFARGGTIIRCCASDPHNPSTPPHETRVWRGPRTSTPSREKRACWGPRACGSKVLIFLFVYPPLTQSDPRFRGPNCDVVGYYQPSLRDWYVVVLTDSRAHRSGAPINNASLASAGEGACAPCLILKLRLAATCVDKKSPVSRPGSRFSFPLLSF